MSWVFLIIAFGLIGILVEVLLAYQKEANEITEKQLHNRQQIQAHQHAIEEARTNAEELNAGLTQVQAQATALKTSIGETKDHLDTLKETQKRRHPTRHKLEDAQ